MFICSSGKTWGWSTFFASSSGRAELSDRFYATFAKILTDEPILLQRISEGDQNAFRELFGYYYPKVRCFLAGFIDNEDDVKDLSQNIFVKIWLMRSVLCDIRSFGPYLYRMCRNAAIDYGRRHQVKIPLTDRYEEETAPLDEDYFAREMSWQYSRQVEKMPEKRRQVFLMSRVEGRSNAEIAQLLGITKKTVENHLNAALRELRKLTSCLSLFL